MVGWLVIRSVHKSIDKEGALQAYQQTLLVMIAGLYNTDTRHYSQSASRTVSEGFMPNSGGGRGAKGGMRPERHCAGGGIWRGIRKFGRFSGELAYCSQSTPMPSLYP